MNNPALFSFISAIPFKRQCAALVTCLFLLNPASGQDAIATAQRALQQDNSNALNYSTLALAYRQSWYWTEAKETFEQAYLLDPNDLSILFNYGWFSSFSGDHDRAFELAQHAIRLDPSIANSHRNLAIAYAYAGYEQAASGAFRECIRLDTSIGVCHIYLGFMQSRLGNDDVAERELREAERLFGDTMTSAAASSLAHAYSTINLDNDAQRLFERLQEMDSVNTVALGTWPLAYLGIGDTESAIDWLTRSVEAQEDNQLDGGFFNLMIIKANVQGSAILEEPRFRALRDRIGKM
jgi:tetratricopeptide (TPR) repeat protein